MDSFDEEIFDETNYGVKKIFEDTTSKSFIIFEIYNKGTDKISLIGHYNFPFADHLNDDDIKEIVMTLLSRINIFSSKISNEQISKSPIWVNLSVGFKF